MGLILGDKEMYTKEFYSLEEIQQYYDERANTYIFKENNSYIKKVIFNFDLNVEANIDARDIQAHNMRAFNIDACEIKAQNIMSYDIQAYSVEAEYVRSTDITSNYIFVNRIDAADIWAVVIIADYISYHAVCYAYKIIQCKHIEGAYKFSQHFVLFGALEVKEND